MAKIKTEYPKLTFYGGTGTVTGANFLLEDEDTKILIDCGLIQGMNSFEVNRKPFPYDPKEIDYLFITHGHIDHIGRIGKLVKEGFTGKIYSTPVTKEIAKPMLDDAVSLLSRAAKRKDVEALYGSNDVDKAFSLWHTIDYHEEQTFGNFKFFPKDAGHVLGSVMYEITYKPSGKKIVFTGDLGNSPSPILKDTEEVTDADYLIMESVYGDRIHKDKEDRKEKLKVILNKIIEKKGTLLIPVFSLEKTQVLLHEMNDLIEGGEVPSVPVFLDSPLGIKLTSIYQNPKNTSLFNGHIQKEIKAGDDIFDFPKLKLTLHQRESKGIDKTKSPKIIISSSGMSVGGRVVEHERKYLPGKENGLLLIGYQVAGSMGRRIRDGAKEIEINHKRVKVRAEIFSMDGYSSHKDSEGLLEFVDNTADTVKKVFMVMGEPRSALFLVQKVRDLLEVDAIHPEEGQSFILD